MGASEEKRRCLEGKEKVEFEKRRGATQLYNHECLPRELILEKQQGQLSSRPRWPSEDGVAQ